MPKPYIGITDFTHPSQVRRMLAAVRSSRTPHWDRRLAVGVMMSRKTLLGLPTEWSAAFPKNEQVAGIFLDEPDVYNVLHYADYKNISALDNLLKARYWAGSHVHAIQLDMVWPDPADIIGFRWRNPGTEVILQINTEALKAVGNDPDGLVIRLKGYLANSLTYVLLDKSMGKGLGMDAQGLLPFARAIVAQLPTMGIAVAGGLGPDTLHLADDIIDSFPGVSIDAQGRLRPSGDARDPVNWDMAERYIIGAATHYDQIIANRC